MSLKIYFLVRKRATQNKSLDLATGSDFRIKRDLAMDKSNEPLAGATVHILYVWKWLQYPYPEQSCGAYVDSTELVECASNSNGIVIVPEHTVETRGWSANPKCWWSLVHKKGEPHFDGMELRVSEKPYATGFIWSKGDVNKLRAKNKEIVLHVPITRLTNGYGLPIDEVTGKPIRQRKQ